MYCNFCIEACPTKAICWDKNYENSRYFKDALDVDCLAASQEKSAGAQADRPSSKEPDGGVKDE